MASDGNEQDAAQRSGSLETLPREISPDLLRTDKVLTEDQKTRIRIILKEEEEELARVGAGPLALQLKKNIQLRHAILSEKWRIPVEIWRKIFAMACTSDGYFEILVDPTWRGLPKPAVLSQVCALWRTIAMEYAWLWSEFRIHLIDLPVPAQGAFRRYLEVSKPHPLTVELFRNGNFRRVSLSQSQGAREVLEILAPHFPRVKHLSINIASNVPLELPALENPIALDALTTYTGRYARGLDQALHSASNLRSITTSTTFPQSSIQYAQITTLRISATHSNVIRQLFTVLPLCTGLEVLEVLGVAELEDREPVQQTELSAVTLPQLHTFHISDYQSFCVSVRSVLASLVAPRLATLKLQFSEHAPGSAWPNELAEFLQRHSGTMTTLSVYIRRSVDPSSNIPTFPFLSHLLQYTPNIVSFDVIVQREGYGIPPSNWLNYNTHYLEEVYMELRESTPFFAPALTSLSVQMSDITLETGNVLQDFLHAVMKRNQTVRGSASAPLTKVYLARFPHGRTYPRIFEESFPRDILPVSLSNVVLGEIEELRRTGVNVEIQDLSYVPAYFET